MRNNKRNNRLLHHRPRRRLATCAMALACLASTQVQAGPVPGQGTWETTLQARDINADGTVDAWYDTVRNVSWLADANAIRGTVYDDGFSTNDGRVTYASANSWVASLDVYGVTGWRIPGQDISFLYQDTLGNATGFVPMGMGGWSNTGPFANVANASGSGWYWSGSAASPIPGDFTASVWVADGLGAYFYDESKTHNYGAWAVKSGDVVAAVPEPETWSLMVLGLAIVGTIARKRLHNT